MAKKASWIPAMVPTNVALQTRFPQQGQSPIKLREKLRLYCFATKMLYWNKKQLLQGLAFSIWPAYLCSRAIG